MPNMQSFKSEDYPILLAANEIDATDGALFNTAALLKPNTMDRTILIGLGGTGIQTLDYVKGVITNRLDPTWSSYVGFLGIDTDGTELSRAKYLQQGELVLTTRPGVENRKMNPMAYPQAWRRFADPKVMAKVPDMNSSGASRKRLVGRLKIHDRDTVGAVDMEIVQKLANLKANTLAPTVGGSNYEVYVIGSVSGGTCSGGFLEMPALIRRALGVGNLHIYAMLYLPDTLTSLDPANAAELKANGYASLKELNYYQGIAMRPGYNEKFGYNDPAAPELELTGGQPFYDIPYLIGTVSGATANASRVARQNIAEFLISLLSGVSVTSGTPFLTASFLSNVIPRQSVKEQMPGVPETEAAGWRHEFPRHYGAIGFAQIAAPKKIVRSYVVGKACAEAGFKPVSVEKRDEMIASGAPLLPFRGVDDYMNATEGTAKAREILAPVLPLLQTIHSADFSFMAATGWPAENLWDSLYKRQHEVGAMPVKLNAAFEDRIGPAAMKALENEIAKAFTAYRTNVQSFVEQEGPLAFDNLYHGRFTKVGDNSGIGIETMLRRLRGGKTILDAQFRWDTPAAKAKDLEVAQQEVHKASNLAGLLGRRTKAASAWVFAYDKWQQARIIEKRREFALGDVGKFNELFLHPAALLADQLRAFGDTLAAMSDIYAAHGNCLEDFGTFSHARDNDTEINLCAVSAASHGWLLREAQAQLRAVNAKEIRTKMVQDFFEDSAAWMSIPENMVVLRDGKPALAKEGTAVPARERFDKLMQSVVPDTLALSIEKTFEAINETGTDYTTFAQAVVEKLVQASGIMLRANIDGSNFNRYLMYPSSLKLSSDGIQIANALETAAKNAFPGIQVYASEDAESIKLYQLAAPFELYRLQSEGTDQGDHDLRDWENNYMVRFDDLLHGMSQDVETEIVPGQAPRYTEITPWKDYPSVLRYNTDPKQPDPVSGAVCYEGQVRRKLAELIERARKLGVLYCKKAGDQQYTVYRVNCDRSINWSLDLSIMPRDALGLLPTGMALADAVASQNGRRLEDISRAVELSQGGLLSGPHTTEAWAWKWVERTLRAHMPMMIEIRNTVQKFEAWYKIIEKENALVLARMKPAKMIFMIRGQILRCDENGMWKLKLANGMEKPIANMGANGMRMLEMTNPKGARLIKNGFSAYYLFSGLMKQVEMQGDGFDEAYERSRRRLGELAEEFDEAAIMAGVEMSDFVLKEAEALNELGAMLSEGEDANLRGSFLEAMKRKDITDEAQIRDIRSFYLRAMLWEQL